jgi:hypothetical protein
LIKGLARPCGNPKIRMLAAVAVDQMPDYGRVPFAAAWGRDAAIVQRIGDLLQGNPQHSVGLTRVCSFELTR